jgi:hypothetical protein
VPDVLQLPTEAPGLMCVPHTSTASNNTAISILFHESLDRISEIPTMGINIEKSVMAFRERLSRLVLQ